MILYKKIFAWLCFYLSHNSDRDGEGSIPFTAGLFVSETNEYFSIKMGKKELFKAVIIGQSDVNINEKKFKQDALTYFHGLRRLKYPAPPEFVERVLCFH